jgi:hypothetical protein
MARKKKSSSVFQVMSAPTILQPSLNSRMEPATGLLTRAVRVNENYLLAESCDIFQKQDIDIKFYIQGGPRSSVADIGKKWVEGQLVFKLFVDSNGDVLTPIRDILKNAEIPNTVIKLDTNHVLSHLNLSAEDGGSDNNKLVSLDGMVVKELVISASPEKDVTITCKFYGTIDLRLNGDFITPEDIAISRAITWADCDASRFSSAMRTVSSMEFKIDNVIQDVTFLTNYFSERDDQVSYFGVKETRWQGSYDEFLRLGMEVDNYFHGGWKVGENMLFDFGAVRFYSRVPLFFKSEQPINSKLLLRKSKFLTLTSPDQNSPQGKLIYFAEDII